VKDFAEGELELLIAEGERSIAEEGTVDGDEAFEARQRQRQAMRFAPSPSGRGLG